MINATIFETKTNLSELLKQVQAGETVIITAGREKKPVAKLQAVEPKEPQRLGLLYDANCKLTDGFWDPLPEDELRLWDEGEPDDPLYTGRPR